MELYQTYETDQKAEQEGVPVTFAGDFVIGIRSVKSKKVRACETRLAKKNRQYFMRGGSVPDEVQDADNVERCVAIVAFWYHKVKDGNKTVQRPPKGKSGEALECTPVNVREVMTDLWELREQVIGAAAMAETFRAEELKAASENLALASAPSSASAAPEA